MNKAFLVDVGGTNMRYAFANSIDDDISEINKQPFKAKEFEGFIQRIIDENNISILIISIAGPKINNSITMTNRSYTFDGDKIKKKYNLQECILLNDWEAIAHSYDYISNDIELIKPGLKFNDTRLFLGPGTGLGASLSIGNKVVLPTEVGNTTNSNLFLERNYNIKADKTLILEDLVSGSAISSIYDLKTNIKTTSEDVYQKYKDKDELAVEVIEGFIRSLSETLSDLALTYIPGDGILLAGSLMRTIYKDINKEEFKNIFIENKNKTHQEMLKMISIGVITKEKTPLYGNFNVLKKISS
ncbi:MAG: hypothetical protein CMD46_03580 [Gammaproteobacteria bacterium]|nr:hypothetical protein [Gammaproteobacteria bacterium]|tara:strand:+ start:1532 stop:2434 length:903 start_codon:yes stop_codon:yes gene_type:complete